MAVCGNAYAIKKDSLQLDAGVRTGTLPNGFTYYIRKNVEPKNRGVFYLANKVGSILETEQERGLAHFVEHMAFKGTKNFPKNQMIDYLQSVGVRFGADLNAYTSFDETVYQLPLPTGDAKVVEKGLSILKDWASAVVMDSLEMEAERGVILEEKRLRKSASERMRESYWPVILNNSRYVDRLPVGTEQVLKNASFSTIKNFYSRWYRPDLQALIAVGDFDPDAMEKMVVALFSDLKSPHVRQERTTYNVPLTGKNQFVKVTDAEYTSRVIQLMVKHPASVTKTSTDLRDDLVKSIINQLMASRFSELSKQANPPFLQANTSLGGFFKGVDVASAVVSAKENAIESGFKTMYTEIERVRQHGFTQSELDRAKNAVLVGQESIYKEKDKTSSASYVQSYLNHFLKGDVSPGHDYLYNFYKQEVGKVTLADLKNVFNSLYSDNNRDILVMGPESENQSLPNEAQVLQWMADVKASKISAYDDMASAAPLLGKLPVSGRIVKEKHIASLGVTELTLSNGVKVVLKPTDFKNDEIAFSAFSPGGFSLYSDQNYQSAVNATSLVASSGVGAFSAKQLPKILSGKLLSLSPYISERNEGFRGSATPKDFESLMQLMYLFFTEPKADKEIFKGIITNYKSSLLGRENVPEQVFADTVNAVLGAYHIRNTGPSLEKADQINLDKAFEIYKDRFADASDFTFVFTGNFQDSTIRPILEQYVATLPSLNRKESWKDAGIRTPKGKIRKNVFKGSEDKATVQLVLSGDYKEGKKEKLIVEALEEVLSFRMLDRLRKKESGIYSPGVSLSSSMYPVPSYRVGVSFGCAPGNVETLIKAAEEELQLLADKGALASELEKFKAEAKLERETALKTNSFWRNELVASYREQKNPEKLLEFEKTLASIHLSDLRKAAKRYFDLRNYMIFVLFPEQFKGKM